MWTLPGEHNVQCPVQTPNTTVNINAKYDCHPYIVDARLGGTRVELGGWPPVLLCFEQLYDRDVVLNRATCLERTGLMITEDMTRSPDT